MKMVVLFILLTIFLWVFCSPMFAILGWFFKKLLNLDNEGEKENEK